LAGRNFVFLQLGIRFASGLVDVSERLPGRRINFISAQIPDAGEDVSDFFSSLERASAFEIFFLGMLD
jgi:hypothetical protein